MQTASFTVAVGDVEQPVFISFPSDISLSVVFPTTTATATWVEPTATDNAPNIVTVAQTAGLVSGSTFPIGTTVVTYTATDAIGNTITQSFTVTVAAIPPGTITFIVNSDEDGMYNIISAEAALNTAIVVNSGSGTSGSITHRTGFFPIAFTIPNGIGVESAHCSSSTSTLSADSKSGTIVITPGMAVTCTITTQGSLKKTVTQIGQSLEKRSQLIIQHQANLSRRIERLEGRYSGNGGVSGFGFSLKNDRIPFTVRIGSNDISFSYSCLLYTSPSPRD